MNRSNNKKTTSASKLNTGQRFSAGFTLIELLVVIVVVAILAAVSVVAYRGISNRASDTAVQSDLAQMYKSYHINSVDGGADLFGIVDDHSDWGNYERIDGESFNLITDLGQDEFKRLLGITPDRPYYYNKGDSISLVHTWEYTSYYDQNTGTYRYKNTPVFYARSASGKVFRHDGRITQDLGSESSETADELRDNIALYEHEINRIDACYGGSAPAEECEGMSEWPPLSEWQTEKEGALLQVAEWRSTLKELEGGYSLSNPLPNCGSALVFFQGTSKWYYYGAEC